MAPLAAPTIWLDLYPNSFLGPLHAPVEQLLLRINGAPTHLKD